MAWRSTYLDAEVDSAGGMVDSVGGEAGMMATVDMAMVAAVRVVRARAVVVRVKVWACERVGRAYVMKLAAMMGGKVILVKVKAVAMLIDQMRENVKHQGRVTAQARAMVTEGEGGGAMEEDMWRVGVAKGAEVKGVVVDRGDDRKPSQKCRHHLWP